MIKLTKLLHQQLLALRTTSRARLFLLGADAKNKLTAFLPLKPSGGCCYLPGINEEVMAKAVLKLYKQGLTPVGFAFIDTSVELSFYKGKYKGLHVYASYVTL